jgi:hypothetical protein
MLAEFQNQMVTGKDGKIVCCDDCGSSVLYDPDNGKLIFQCECGTVDPNSLPDWLRCELDLDDFESLDDERDRINQGAREIRESWGYK